MKASSSSASRRRTRRNPERLKALEDAEVATRRRPRSRQRRAGLEEYEIQRLHQFQYSNTDKQALPSRSISHSAGSARAGADDRLPSHPATERGLRGRDEPHGHALKDAILDYDMTPDFGFGSKVSLRNRCRYRSDSTSKRATPTATAGAGHLQPDALQRRAEPGRHPRGTSTTSMSKREVCHEAMTTDDPEQAGLAPGQGSKIAGLGYLRAVGPNYRAGISGFRANGPPHGGGEHPPQVNRSFTYIDGNGVSLTDSFEARPCRHDRVPSATAAATKTGKNMAGFQAQSATTSTRRTS